MSKNQLIPPTNEQTLRKRLKERTSFSWRTLTPLGFLLLVCVIPLADKQHPTNIDIGLGAAMVVILIFQLLLGICVAIWRKIKPESGPAARRSCFWFNILFIALVTCGLMILAGRPTLYNGKTLMALSTAIMWMYLLFELIQINRLILSCTQPLARKAQIQASPCPNVFHRWNTAKMCFWAPFVFFLIGVILWISCAGIPDQTKNAYQAGIIAAVPGFLLFWPISFLALLLKQTDAPSSFQDFVRDMVWLIISPKRGFSQKETAAFRWWLSHPGQPWPQDMAYLAHFIDTKSFNWQNPNAWETPLQQAQKEFEKYVAENDPEVIEQLLN